MGGDAHGTNTGTKQLTQLAEVLSNVMNEIFCGWMVEWTWPGGRGMMWIPHQVRNDKED
jgi:hypothetical protein